MDKVDATIDMLKRHNLWRRGDETVEMADPTLLGTAIDVACEELERIRAELETAKQESEYHRFHKEQALRNWEAANTERTAARAELAAMKAQKPVAWQFMHAGVLDSGEFRTMPPTVSAGLYRPLYAHPAPDLLAEAVPDGVDLWSFLRDVLKRGAAIESQFSQQGYETFVSEIEAAARSENKKLRAFLAKVDARSGKDGV